VKKWRWCHDNLHFQATSAGKRLFSQEFHHMRKKNATGIHHNAPQFPEREIRKLDFARFALVARPTRVLDTKPY
jgi:hypothetical protein